MAVVMLVMFLLGFFLDFIEIIFVVVPLVGPVLLGMRKSVHILQMGSSAKEILDMVRLAVVDAQIKSVQP